MDVNKRDTRHKICDCIKQIQTNWKGVLKATRNMGKGSHKVFKTVVKEISQYLPPLGESGSEVYHFIPEAINSAEVTKFSDDIKRPWLNKTQKEIKNLINNQNFLVQEPEKGEPVNPCMNFYKAKIKSDGSVDKLKLSIVVRGDLNNKSLVGYTCSPTASVVLVAE